MLRKSKNKQEGTYNCDCAMTGHPSIAVRVQCAKYRNVPKNLAKTIDKHTGNAYNNKCLIKFQ